MGLEMVGLRTVEERFAAGFYLPKRRTVQVAIGNFGLKQTPGANSRSPTTAWCTPYCLTNALPREKGFVTLDHDAQINAQRLEVPSFIRLQVVNTANTYKPVQ